MRRGQGEEEAQAEGGGEVTLGRGRQVLWWWQLDILSFPFVDALDKIGLRLRQDAIRQRGGGLRGKQAETRGFSRGVEQSRQGGSRCKEELEGNRGEW